MQGPTFDSNTSGLQGKMQALREYLDWYAKMARDRLGRDEPGPDLRNTEVFVRKYGQAFIPKARPPKVKKERDQRCFQNSLELAQRTGYTYVEGIALSIIPTHHAWCVNDQGEVIDPTYKDPEHCAYFGVPLKLDYVCETAVRTRVYGVISHTNPELYSTPQEIWHAPLPDFAHP